MSMKGSATAGRRESRVSGWTYCYSALLRRGALNNWQRRAESAGINWQYFIDEKRYFSIGFLMLSFMLYFPWTFLDETPIQLFSMSCGALNPPIFSEIIIVSLKHEIIAWQRNVPDLTLSMETTQSLACINSEPSHSFLPSTSTAILLRTNHYWEANCTFSQH